MFDRHTRNSPVSENGMYPAVNRNYYNPSFFSSRQTALIEPGEQVLVVINTSDKLSKYYGFADTVAEQTNKQMTLQVTNTHGTKNVEVKIGLSLDSFLSHPFVISGFCSAVENDIGCVETFHYWEAKQQRDGLSSLPSAYLEPFHLTKYSRGGKHLQESAIEEEPEEEVLVSDDDYGNSQGTHNDENPSPSWINNDIAY